MEMQTPLTRLLAATKGATTHCNVPNLLSAENILDSSSSEHVMLTYLFTFRTCVTNKDFQPTSSGDGSKGKFGTTRGVPKELKAGVETFQAGPEHSELNCSVCERSLIGEGLLVKAMPEEIVYHAKCFVCKKCQQPFEEYYWPWQLIPYCFDHYVEAAGLVCSSCDEKILENAVVVHGRKFHPQCYCCSKEGCNYEFTDSYNLYEGKAYCDDHYKEFVAISCHVCGLEVSGEQVIKSMGQVFHRRCFFCDRCGIQILSEGKDPLPFLAMDGKPLCIPCSKETMEGGDPNRCMKCLEEIKEGHMVQAMGKAWCSGCFVCTSCGSPFKGSFFNVGGKPYDEACAKKL
jgi:paxillin